VKTYPDINNQTKSAIDLLNDSSDSGVSPGGIYSPSNAEARRLDVVNLSSSKTSLAIKAGGHKVLPTENDFKVKNVI
jgi:hypothetical protein